MESLSKYELSARIKEAAAALGFRACGISAAGHLAEDQTRLDQWLDNGYHGEMSYMERNREKRTDPRKLLEGARSVISVLMNYHSGEQLPDENNYKIARYAYGQDYHPVIRDRLYALVEGLKATGTDFKARVFTDSAPVLDRAWAEKAGLGWIGKNTCLIHPKLGSYVFIGEIITDLDLHCDTSRINDLCGGCTRCIDACPTGAIVAPGELDARKCIAYLTIEKRGDIDPRFRPAFGKWIFGCDICQEVCPWNRRPLSDTIPEFRPSAALKAMTGEKWETLTKEEFQELFGRSAVQRTGYEGLKRNIEFVRYR